MLKDAPQDPLSAPTSAHALHWLSPVSVGPGIHMKSHEDSQSGSAKDILFERIQMHSVGKAIDISNRNQDLANQHRWTDQDERYRVASGVNTYDNVTFRHISVASATYAFHFDCVGEAPCTNFDFTDVQISWSVKPWDQCSNVSGWWNRSDVSPSLDMCLQQAPLPSSRARRPG